MGVTREGSKRLYICMVMCADGSSTKDLRARHVMERAISGFGLDLSGSSNSELGYWRLLP